MYFYSNVLYETVYPLYLNSFIYSAYQSYLNPSDLKNFSSSTLFNTSFHSSNLSITLILKQPPYRTNLSNHPAYPIHIQLIHVIEFILHLRETELITPQSSFNSFSFPISSSNHNIQLIVLILQLIRLTELIRQLILQLIQLIDLTVHQFQLTKLFLSIQYTHRPLIHPAYRPNPSTHPVYRPISSTMPTKNLSFNSSSLLNSFSTHPTHPLPHSADPTNLLPHSANRTYS